MDIIKIGRLKFRDSELNDHYFSGKKFIIAYRSVYALEWCENYINSDGSYGGCAGREIFYAAEPLTKRGKFEFVTAADVNEKIGHNLLIVR